MEPINYLGDIVASSVAIDGTATVRINFGQDLDKRGEELENSIQDALRQKDEKKKIRKLGQLAKHFPAVRNHKNVVELLDDLVNKRNFNAVKRICGESY